MVWQWKMHLSRNVRFYFSFVSYSYRIFFPVVFFVFISCCVQTSFLGSRIVSFVHSWIWRSISSSFSTENHQFFHILLMSGAEPGKPLFYRHSIYIFFFSPSFAFNFSTRLRNLLWVTSSRIYIRGNLTWTFVLPHKG